MLSNKKENNLAFCKVIFIHHIRIMYPYINLFNKNVSTYGILMCIGIAVVFLLAFKRIKKHNISIDDMFIITAFSLLIGLFSASSLNTFVTYPFSFIIKSILAGKFEIFGGLVYYGGLLGGIIGAIIGIKIAKVKTQIVEISVIPFLPIGHAIGRIGCIMAGCCNGMKYDGMFAIHYPRSIVGLSVEQGYFPVQLLEAVLNIIIAVILIIYSKKEKPKYNILFLYLTFYAIVRFFLEFLRGDEIRGIYLGVSTSQWISIFLLIISLIYFFVSYYKLQKSKTC